MLRSKLILVFCALGLSVQAQFKLVQLPAPVDIVYEYSQVEPSIAINPLNPKVMAAGSVLSDYYYSKNGGKKWKSKTLKSPYGVYGDPVLMFDTKGRVYYFHLASYKDVHLDRIVCQSADKVCADFSEGSFPKPNGTKVQDKHWTVINQENNEIYMTWTQFDAYDSDDPADSSIIVFSKSADQGETWSDPVNLGAGINTVNNDTHFVYSATQNKGYIAGLEIVGKKASMDLYEIDMTGFAFPE